MNDQAFVLLKGIERGNKFFTNNSDEDPTVDENGVVIFEILGYAKTVQEAQIKLYGRVFD